MEDNKTGYRIRDIVVTRAIIEAGRLLESDVLDHIVIGQGKFIR